MKLFPINKIRILHDVVYFNLSLLSSSKFSKLKLLIVKQIEIDKKLVQS